MEGGVGPRGMEPSSWLERGRIGGRFDNSRDAVDTCRAVVRTAVQQQQDRARMTRVGVHTQSTLKLL